MYFTETLTELIQQKYVKTTQRKLYSKSKIPKFTSVYWTMDWYTLNPFFFNALHIKNILHL